MEYELWSALVFAALVLGFILGVVVGFFLKKEFDKMKVDDDNEVTYVGTYFDHGKEKTIDISATNYEDACRKFHEFLLSVDSGMSFIAYNDKLELKK